MERFSTQWWDAFAKKAARDPEDFPLVGRPTGEALRSLDLLQMPSEQWQELAALSHALRDQGQEISPEHLLPMLIHAVYRRFEKQGAASLRELVQDAEAAE